MARPILPTFDYRNEQIDFNERHIRDNYNLNIENWAKFRYAINVGVTPANVIGTSNQDIIDSYLELGKGHYEVICSLGYVKYAMDQYNGSDKFAKFKAIKDFYFHGGSLLDNISRLIYIIKVPGAATKKTKKGVLERHKMDRGMLLRDYSTDIVTYISDIDNDTIRQIVNVRNAITHYWRIPIRSLEWPLSELSTKRAFAWPYSEVPYSRYSNWTPIHVILQSHFESLECTQNNIFGKLVTDIVYFETDNNIQIK